jgi:hypothetical protein
MNGRVSLQQKLHRIATSIDDSAIVAYDFNRAMFTLKAIDRRDMSLPEPFVDDSKDDTLADAIRLHWGI